MRVHPFSNPSSARGQRLISPACGSLAELARGLALERAGGGPQQELELQAERRVLLGRALEAQQQALAPLHAPDQALHRPARRRRPQRLPGQAHVCCNLLRPGILQVRVFNTCSMSQGLPYLFPPSPHMPHAMTAQRKVLPGTGCCCMQTTGLPCSRMLGQSTATLTTPSRLLRVGNMQPHAAAAARREPSPEPWRSRHCRAGTEAQQTAP